MLGVYTTVSRPDGVGQDVPENATMTRAKRPAALPTWAVEIPAAIAPAIARVAAVSSSLCVLAGSADWNTPAVPIETEKARAILSGIDQGPEL
jgi:hypothetical protein